MITKPNLTIETLKNLWGELFLNKTDKVSDISDNSVLNATAFADSKVAQKAIKDIAIVESQLFPETAQGEYLDRAANLFGVSPRRGAIGSSTYIKLIANEGTEYLSGVHEFVNTNGLRFELENSITIGVNGYGYVKVRSVDAGRKTNVEANSIISISPIPTGHTAVTNEYYAIGGIDSETDEVFRLRIKNNLNILSIGTIEYFTQLMQQYDDRVLRVVNLGIDEDGKRTLAILTQNGIDFLESELEELLNNTKSFFPVTDLNRFGDTIGIKYVNPVWHYVGGNDGIDFRVQIRDNYNPDNVRRDVQVALTKYLDFRFWEYGNKVEWDDLLQIVKETNGVRYVPDTWFKPRTDELVPINRFPRVKDFKMRDIEGNIIFDSGGNLSPVFYPNE
jgi:uncharacterized phage protein gp47/JayE